MNELEQTEEIITENGNIPFKINNKNDYLTTFTENYAFVSEIWKGIYHGRK